MELKPWDIKDYLKNKEDVINYLQGAIQENDLKFLCIACKDVVDAAKKHGWLK